MKRVSFKWREGYLVLTDNNGELVVEALNSTITFTVREVLVKGLFEGLREYVEGGRGEWKTVYIDLAFPLKGKPKPVDVAFARHVDTYVGGFGLSYTVIEGVGHYITVYPPPGALYDHAIIYDDGVALRTLSRRKVYILEENNTRKIILF